MEIHSSWQTQLELKTRKIKKKESKWTKQNMENKRNKSVVVKELNHAWIQTQEALMQMRGRKRNSGATGSIHANVPLDSACRATNKKQRQHNKPGGRRLSPKLEG